MTKTTSRQAPLALAGVALALLGAGATAAPIQWAANGHYYEVIDVSVGITWADAKAAAEALGHLGTPGHLVTVTSGAENGFLTATFGGDGLESRWLGLFQPPGSPEPAGGWTWVTGEAFAYNNWWPGEPNDAGGEDSGIFQHGITADGKAWNDLPGQVLAPGFVVEFDAVPEPGALLLLAVGLAGLGFTRRR